MIEIDFGNHPDNIIRIPREGELPQFGLVVQDKQLQISSTRLITDGWPYRATRYEFLTYGDLAKLEPYQGYTQGRSLVIVSRPRLNRIEEDHELLILWIQERDEWIAIFHRAWWWSDGVDMEDFVGPFAIDEMSSRKILQAYGISEGKFPLNGVRWMSPERLRELSIS